MNDKSAPAPGNASPLLTVCMPTYKRGRFAEAQARSVITHLLNRFGDKVELVVVNNCSPDDTKERLDKLSHPALRVVHLTVHYPTAEENMMRALKHVRGEYVWFLGDDDVIHPPGLAVMMEQLERRTLDCLVFNSPTIRKQGGLELLQPIPLREFKFEAALAQVVESIGILYTFAGFSNLIHRAQKLSTDKGLNWLKRSAIYSHTGWFIESHANSRAALVNVALVFYRQNDYSDGHWDRVAEKSGVQNLYFWSLGLIRILSRLAEVGAMSYEQIGRIQEVGQAGNRYKLVDDLVMKTFQQMELWSRSGEGRQEFTRGQMIEISTFLLNSDPSLYDLVSILSDGHTALAASFRFKTVPAVFSSFEQQFRSTFVKREQDYFLQRFVGRMHGYEVYRLSNRYVALTADDVPLRNEILSVVDYEPDGTRSITGDSLEQLISKLLQARDDRQVRARERSAEAPVVNVTPPPPVITVQAAPAGITVQAAAPIVNPLQPYLEEALRQREFEVEALKREVMEIRQSTSWSLTGPVRAVGRLFKGGPRAQKQIAG